MAKKQEKKNNESVIDFTDNQISVDKRIKILMVWFLMPGLEPIPACTCHIYICVNPTFKKPGQNIQAVEDYNTKHC